MKPRTVKLLIAIVLGAAAVIALPFSLRTINELRRFLAEWIARMNPIYLAISLPSALQYPGEAPNSALAYFDGYRTVNLPANLLQAQRDYFGAHTYERVDRPRGEFFHTNWTGRGGTTSSSSYVV